MKMALACDHKGFVLKETIKGYLASEGIETLDLGTDSDVSVDYPVYGRLCGEAVASGEADRGVVCCATGIGISMAANKVKGVRCALCTDKGMAEMSRKHNDANMIALGGVTTEKGAAIEMIKTWIETEFEGGRHQRRVDMLDEM